MININITRDPYDADGNAQIFQISFKLICDTDDDLYCYDSDLVTLRETDYWLMFDTVDGFSITIKKDQIAFVEISPKFEDDEDNDLEDEPSASIRSDHAGTIWIYHERPSIRRLIALRFKALLERIFC